MLSRIIILAVMGTLMTAPLAHGEGTLANPVCPPTQEEKGTLDETYCAKYEITSATKARREAEEAAPVSFLNVRPEKNTLGREASYKEPGEWFITIETNPLARVIIHDTHNGLISGRQQPSLEHDQVAWAEILLLEPKGEQTQWVNESVWVDTEALNVPWSCQHRRAVDHYTVEARGYLAGEPIVRSGQVSLGQRSARWCAAAKRREAAAKARKRAEENRHYAERIRHEREARERREREEAEQTRLFETNCRAIGGTPVVVRSRETGNLIVVCRSPGGGTLPVP